MEWSEKFNDIATKLGNPVCSEEIRGRSIRFLSRPEESGKYVALSATITSIVAMRESIDEKYYSQIRLYLDIPTAYLAWDGDLWKLWPIVEDDWNFGLDGCVEGEVELL